MSLFQKRETLVQNIAYMAIMAAINVIFVLLTAVLPPLMFLIIFVLPLTSTVVTLFCKKKYFPIYFITTIGLCLAVTSGIYIWDTFFYVLPSMITGFIFGLLIEKNVPAIYIVTISSAVQYIITYLTFLLLDTLLPDLNFIDALLNIFGLSEFAFKAVFVHCFLFVLAFIQTLFTYATIAFEIKKLGFEFNLEVQHKIILPIIGISLSGIGVALAFIYVPLAYVFLMLNLPIMVYIVVELVLLKKKLIYLLLVVSIFIAGFLFALCYTLLASPTQIILIAPLYGLILIIYFVNYLFIEQKSLK